MNINKFNTQDYDSHQHTASFQPMKASRKHSHNNDNEAKTGKAWSRVDKRKMWREDV